MPLKPGMFWMWDDVLIVKGLRRTAQADTLCAIQMSLFLHQQAFLWLQVLNVLPTDPYEQLKLAHRIGCRAFSQKVASLEGEVAHLKRALGDKAGHIRSLETRLTSCQLELQKAQDKASHIPCSSYLCTTCFLLVKAVQLQAMICQGVF